MPLTTPTLRTERLRLRPVDASDAVPVAPVLGEVFALIFCLSDLNGSC